MTTIRKSLPADAPTIAEFNIALAAETENKKLDPEIILPGVRALIENEQLGFYLVAEDADRVVGMLMVTNEWSDWRNGMFWWVQSVYVHPDYRRQGIYRSLYQTVQELSAEHAVCGFRLYVEQENIAAQKTYQKLGMTRTPYQMFEQARES